ncbi:MAG: ABC transporter ATP-binding protein [Burkholderiaceae bacterium]|nr:ABC transporter ATP-binding protein [Burkholderiaceae bacterium]
MVNNAHTFTETQSKAVEILNLHKRFGTLEVLRDINFTVAAGEIVALVGTSGCGKSTLLNIVSGLLGHDAGFVRIDGHTAKDFDGWQRLSYMFQEDRLLPWRSVRDNVAFGLEGRGSSKTERDARADRALNAVGLNAFAESWPHQLSGGMRSRVALARSLVVDPTILLMDEPFSKLDPQTRSDMHDEVLRAQARTHAAIIFVTHDVEEAVVLADRVIVLEPRPGRVRCIVPIDLPRPRIPTDIAVTEQTRQLRLQVVQA